MQHGRVQCPSLTRMHRGEKALCVAPELPSSAQSVNEHCGPSQSWNSLYATALTITSSCTRNASESMGGMAAPPALSIEQAPDCLCAAGRGCHCMFSLAPKCLLQMQAFLHPG